MSGRDTAANRSYYLVFWVVVVMSDELESDHDRTLSTDMLIYIQSKCVVV